MREPLLAHQVVGLESCLEVTHMDANRASHKHVLRSLGNLPIYTQKVGLLQRFEAEEVVVKVTGVVYHFIYALKVISEDSVYVIGEERSWSSLLILVVEKLVGDIQDAGVSGVVQRLYRDLVCKLCVVRVDDGHVGACLSSQISNFLGRHS